LNCFPQQKNGKRAWLALGYEIMAIVWLFECMQSFCTFTYVWGSVTNTNTTIIISRVKNEIGQKRSEMRKTPVLQQMSRVMENQFIHRLKIQIK